MSQPTVSSTIEYINSDSNSINEFRLPLPAGLLVFSKDLKEIRIGNGIDKYERLRVLLDLDNHDEILNIRNNLPEITTGQSERALKINSEGKYEVDLSFVTSNIIDQGKLDEALSEYSDTDHTHDNYLEKEDVDDLFYPDKDKLKTHDTYSYVLLNHIVDNNSLPTVEHGTFIDNFSAGGHIDSSLSTDATISGPGSTNPKAIVSSGGTLISNEFTRPFDLDISKLYFRGNIENINTDSKLYVSRDNGNTFVESKLSKMNNLYISTCDYSGQLVSEDLSTALTSIIDFKGGNTRFTIDTDSTSGHLNLGTGSHSIIDYDIHLKNGTILTITNVTNKGTNTDEVSFVTENSIAAGEYLITRITNIRKDSEQSSFFTTTGDLGAFTVHCAEINNLAAFNYHGTEIGALRINNQYLVYKNNEWVPIVRLVDGKWQYKGINGNWNITPYNDPNYNLASALAIAKNRMSFSDLEGISIEEINGTFKGVGMYISENNTYYPYDNIISVEYRDDTVIPDGSSFRYKLVNNSASDIILEGVRVVNR